MTHLTPIFSDEYKRFILENMFKKGGKLYIDFSIEPCEFPKDFVSPSPEEFYRREIDADLFRISPIVHICEGGKEFRGCFFSNTEDLLFSNFDGKCTKKIYALGVFDKAVGGILLFMVSFDSPIDLATMKYKTKDNKLIFSFPTRSISSHFGTGNFTPTVQEMSKTIDKLGHPGCPFKDPSSCGLYKKSHLCGFNRLDKVCKCVASMSGTSSGIPRATL